MTILDPGISFSQPAGSYPPYEEASPACWVQSDQGGPLVGTVWPGQVGTGQFTRDYH